MAELNSTRLVLLGPPGSGKGTQAARVAAAYGLEHLAIGDLLRAEIAAGTELGQAIRSKVESGALVDDELVVALVRAKLTVAAASGAGYVLDGFPRSLPQAKAGTEIGESTGAGPNLVVYLDVPDHVVISRLLARASIEGRADDTADVIGRRLRVFHSTTKPVLDYYRRRGLARTVRATGNPDEVASSVVAHIHSS